MTNMTTDAAEAREYLKTATIKAVQWWKMGDHPAVREYDDIDGSGEMRAWIDTLEGGHIVTPGDWIATGIQGEHWAIKPDVFAATYAPVESKPLSRHAEGPSFMADRTWPECLDPNAAHNRRPHRLATAEAASGAGEREWPDIGEDPMKAMPYDDRMAVSAAAIRKAYTVQQRIVPDQTALVWRWHLGALLEAEIRLRSILADDEPASLPPATDPAMVEKCAKIADAQADRSRLIVAQLTGPNADPNDERSNHLWVQQSAERIAKNIRALAAAPTIPATGEASDDRCS